MIATVTVMACQSGNTTPREQWRIEEQIHPDLPPLTFVLTGDIVEERAEIDTIAIYTPDNPNKPQQTLTGFKTAFPDLTTGGFVVEDLNFDGYQDLRIPQFLPSSPNIPYFYWLYNPETGKFERNEELEVITSITVHGDQGTLESFQRVSANTFVLETYEFREKNLVLIRRITEIYGTDEQKQVVVEELQGNEWVVTSDEMVPAQP